MSSAPKRTALTRALKHGVPYCHRDGATIYLVTSVDPQSRDGRIAVREMKSAGQAREFQRKAIAESGWRGDAA
jgi:nucleotide-binding universal stress UspA family protein